MSTHEIPARRTRSGHGVRPARDAAPAAGAKPKARPSVKSIVIAPSEAVARGATIGLRSSNPAEVIRAVKSGFPYSRFVMLQKALDVSAQALAGVLRIPVRTLARRKKEGRFSADESERLLRIAALLDKALEVLADPKNARQWLKTSKRALGGRAPLEYADTEPGARTVENVLGCVEHGIFL